MSGTSEPKILGFLCNWCSYAGADLSGVSRFQYPPNIRIVRVMCSTRIDPVHLLKVFKAGADGVLMGGCHLGDCHYLIGNYHTKHKMRMVKLLMAIAGLDPARLRLEWVSASEGMRFSQIVKEFTEEVKGLGRNDIKSDEVLQTRLEAAIDAASGNRLRNLIGHQYKVTEVGNTYGEKVEEDRYDSIIETAVQEEFHRRLIISQLRDQPKSVRQLAKEIEVPSDKVLQYIISLRIENKVANAGHEGMSPLYKALMVGGG